MSPSTLDNTGSDWRQLVSVVVARAALMTALTSITPWASRNGIFSILEPPTGYAEKRFDGGCRGRDGCRDRCHDGRHRFNRIDGRVAEQVVPHRCIEAFRCRGPGSSKSGVSSPFDVPHTRLSSPLAVPQTTLSSPRAVPQTTLSSALCGVDTMLSSFPAAVPHTTLAQLAPPQSVPQTILSSSAEAVPQTTLSSLASANVPHTMLSSEPEAVPQTMLSSLSTVVQVALLQELPKRVPHAIFAPLGVFAAPQTTPSFQAGAVGLTLPFEMR